MSRAACKRQTLVESGLGSVERCSCGAVHVNMGQTTIRMEPAVFEHMVELMLRGRTRLYTQAPSPSANAKILRVPDDVA